jgi:hypothetical protein
MSSTNELKFLLANPLHAIGIIRYLDRQTLINLFIAFAAPYTLHSEENLANRLNQATDSDLRSAMFDLAASVTRHEIPSVHRIIASLPPLHNHGAGGQQNAMPADTVSEQIDCSVEEDTISNKRKRTEEDDGDDIRYGCEAYKLEKDKVDRCREDDADEHEDGIKSSWTRSLATGGAQEDKRRCDFD